MKPSHLKFDAGDVERTFKVTGAEHARVFGSAEGFVTPLTGAEVNTASQLIIDAMVNEALQFVPSPGAPKVRQGPAPSSTAANEPTTA